MENKKFLSDKAAEKSRFRELSTDETTGKNKKCNTDSDKKATNFDLKLFNCTPKFRYNFRTSNWLCNNNSFQNGSQVLAGVSFLNH